MGSPITLTAPNRDYASWGDVMNPAPVAPYEHDSVKTRPIEVPRPGHADYAGGLKYRTLDDMRNVLERASARETTMRVAAGSVARCLLEACDIHIGSHVVEIGGLQVDTSTRPPARQINEIADASEVRCLSDEATEASRRALTRRAKPVIRSAAFLKSSSKACRSAWALTCTGIASWMGAWRRR
jgi:chorismate synthase